MVEKTFNSVWSLIGQHLFSSFNDFPRPEIRLFNDCIEVRFTISNCLKSIPSVGDSWRIFASSSDIVLIYTFNFD